MVINDNLVPAVREIVARLFTAPFDEELIIEIGKRLCLLTDTHYFALIGLARKPKTARPLIVSNNPSDFLPTYASVIDKDFLLDATIRTHREYVMRRAGDFDLPDNRQFVAAVQSARPISDIAYFPIRVSSALCAVFAIGRADANSSFLTDEQLDILRFVMPFVSEAFVRSLNPEPAPDNVAYLDGDGQVLSAGPKAGCILDSLFGTELIIRKSCDSNDCRAAFRRRFFAFAAEPFKPGLDVLRLSHKGRIFYLRFSMIAAGRLGFRCRGVPFLSAAVLDAGPAATPYDMLGLDFAARRFSLSGREREVVAGLYKGWSNKRIAWELGIEEATVKRHTHNIYEKTGFASRVELILGLA